MKTILRWCRVQWDRAIAIALTVLGAIALLLGFAGVRDGLVPAEQLPYFISGGIGGLFLLGIATTLWISADLHDEWRKLDRLEDVLRERSAPAGVENGQRPRRPLRAGASRTVDA